jgi:hypothetical protein
MNIADLWKYELRKGNTDHPRNEACLFDAGMWLVYGKIGDDPPCSCPIIRRYAIGLNDRMPDSQRQRLKPFILRVVGNRDPEAEPARLRYIVLETARRVVSLAFDREWPTLAAEMRSIPDDATYAQVRDLMQKARTAAAAAYAASVASGAAAHAAAAAWAASAASVASVAAAPAAYAASAASVASVAAASSDARVWDESIAILDGVLRIGKQSPEFDEAEVRAAVERFDAARLVNA